MFISETYFLQNMLSNGLYLLFYPHLSKSHLLYFCTVTSFYVSALPLFSCTRPNLFFLCPSVHVIHVLHLPFPVVRTFLSLDFPLLLNLYELFFCMILL